MQTSPELFRYHGADGVPLAGFRWEAAEAPRAILQIAHGAGEHSGRYWKPLAPLLEAGFVIYTADHRGHGQTSGMSRLGDFGRGGAEACVSDMAELSDLARAVHPGLPLFLMGHSMGAMFAQAYLLDHSAKIDGLVLSGTTGPGPRLPGGPNAAFPNPRTEYDWLSRVAEEVDRYIADPFCGIQFSAGAAASLSTLRTRQLSAEKLARVRPGLPVYVFVGDKDPLNRNLEGLHPLITAYRDAGLAVTLKVYPGGRHEMCCRRRPSGSRVISGR